MEFPLIFCCLFACGLTAAFADGPSSYYSGKKLKQKTFVMYKYEKLFYLPHNILVQTNTTF